MSRQLAPEEALIYAMVTTAAVDRAIADSELSRIGSIVTGCDVSIVSIRVMHISLGTPLISAEHDPHFPALQFQRHARSGADSACI